METLIDRDPLAGSPAPGIDTLNNTTECLSLTAESTCAALPPNHLGLELAGEWWLDLSQGIGLYSFRKLQVELRAQEE